MFFGISKLLSFLPGGKTTGKIILVAALILLLVFLYYRFKDNIREDVFQEVFEEQAEDIIEDNQRQQERRIQIEEIQRETVREAHEERTDIKLQEQRIIIEIESDQFEDGEISPVLEHAIDSIREIQNNETTEQNSVIQEWLKGNRDD